MATIPSLERQCEVQTDTHPLLMEQSTTPSADQHVIDIARGGIASPSAPHGDTHDVYGNRPSTVAEVPIEYSSASTSRNVSISRRGDSSGRRHRSPLNSGLWISVEFVVNLSQIIAAIIVLSLSRNEHPQAPLFAWIVGYTAGCFITLPHLFWRYVHRNYQGSEQGLLHRSSSQNNLSEPTSYSVISVAQAPEEHNDNTHMDSRFGRISVNASPRLNAFADHFKMALDCFFAVWFVVGNVWVFGGHSSAADASNLYRLCIAFLTFSCIGYAMPFILCTMICCCLPCIISIMGFREDMDQSRGATSESIDALPTYKFKSKRCMNGEECEINSDGPGEGGILAAGTNKERTISAEDAVCCICLAKYANDDDLRELPCMHYFHMECIDKWLKINALCPLCKFEVGNTAGNVPDSNPGHGHNDRRVGGHNDRRVGSGAEVESEQEMR